MSPRSAVATRVHLKIALLEAAGRSELGEDPDRLLELLAPAIAAIDAEVADLQAAREAEHQALLVERAGRATERRALDKLRQRAERDAVAAISAVQPDILQRPFGYYIYFLHAHNGEVLYVGLSTNILQRLGQHLATPGRGAYITSIKVMECKDEAAMRRLEMAAIRKHQPRWNVHGIVA